MNILALNMIVGAGDGKALRRCLESTHANETFDEIVIVSTSSDEEVKQVAQEYTDKVYDFEWCSEEFPYGNFGGARQKALEETTAEYVMWLDADDVVPVDEQEKLPKLREIAGKGLQSGIEVFFMRYILTLDASEEPSIALMRERIFRRIPKFQWRLPIHEIVCPDQSQLGQVATLGGMSILHLPNKPTFVSACRNLKMLQHEIDKNTDSPHIKYHYGRDMLMAGKHAQGVKALDEFINDMQSNMNNLAAAAMDLMFFFAYQQLELRPNIDMLKLDNVDEVESYARCAIAFEPKYAEAYVVLGDIYTRRGMYDAAEKLYKVAMKKAFGASGAQLLPYYEEVPATRISQLCARKGKYEESLWYNHRARIHNPTDELLQHQRETLLTTMINGV